MDGASGAGNNKREFSDVEEIEDDSLQTQPKRTRPSSFLNGFEAQSVIVAEVLSARQLAILENFIRSVVHEAVEIQVDSYIRSILTRNSQLSVLTGKAVAGSGTLKFKLFFLNQTASTIFTNNEIEAENGKPLQVALCDTTNSNAIIDTGSLSSVLIKFVVLKGEFSSGQRQEETCWSASDFDKNTLSERKGRRPLIVGNDLKIYLKNGIGFINSLSFTDNSSWMKSKKFRLGAKIVEDIISSEFPRIGEAVSEPFRVMDHRGEVNKKHHPPRREDDIWRLEGIGKDGVYHNRLSSEGIKTVDDFLKSYNEKGPDYLRKLLGEKVAKKTWKAMIANALECDAPIAPSALDPSFGVHLAENEGMGGEAFDENLEVVGDNDDRLLQNIEDDKFGGELQDLASFSPSSGVSLSNQELMENEAMGGKALDCNLEVDEHKNFDDDQGLSETFFSDHKFDEELQDLASFHPSFEQILAGNESMRSGAFGEQDYNFMFNDYPSLLPHGEASTSYSHNHEVENASNHNQYCKGLWTELVPKPK